MTKRPPPPSLAAPLGAALAAAVLGLGAWAVMRPSSAPQAPAVVAPPSGSAALPVPTITSISLPPTTTAERVALSERSRMVQEEADHFALLRAQTDAARALAMADEGHLRFVQGRLYPDREVIAIRSLVRLDQREPAQARARRFLSRFADHPQAEMVRRFTGL